MNDVDILKTGTIERGDTYKTPILPAIRKWLEAKCIREIRRAKTGTLREKAINRFSDIPDTSIKVDSVREATGSIDELLVCFSVEERGFTVCDARVGYTSFEELISYFNIPVKYVETYDDLINAIKLSREFKLYKVKEANGRYGIAIDNEYNEAYKVEKINAALGEIAVNFNVSYDGTTMTRTHPHVGEISLEWPGLKTTILEPYPIEEIRQI